MGVFSRARDRDREKERDRDAGKVAAVEDESLTCGGRQVVPSNAMAASASAPASGLGLAPSVTKTPATSLAEEKFLIDFVANYSAGPACLLQGASAVDKPLDVRAHNAVFNPKHAGALQQLATLGKLATEPTGRTEVFSWSFTPLPGDRLVCLGTAKRPPLHPSQDSSESVPGRSTLDAINAAGQSPSATSRLRRTPKEEKVQPHRRDGERWFEIWAGLKVPGISPEDQAAHLDLLRNIDFSATELGPIDSWCPELLNSFTECLASPFPVLLAWGRDPMICLYNFPYGINIGPSKHPKLLGGNYKDSFGELWDLVSAAAEDAFNGKSTHVKNGLLYLQRRDYIEETYFTWSMMPVTAIENGECVMKGLYVPNFDVTSAVITERRLQLLRDASQSFNFTSTPNAMFARISEVVARNRVDLPLLVFYDCGANEGTDSDSQFSSQEQSMLRDSSECASQADERPSKGNPSKQDRQDNGDVGPGNMRMDEQMDTPISTRFTRAAFHGAKESSKVFPPEIDSAAPPYAPSAPPSFAHHLKALQESHKTIILEGKALEEYLPYLDPTELGDELRCILLLPILTVDNILRAVAIVGLNPRKRFDHDYKVFTELFQVQVSHGVASIRLVHEEIRRSRFFAALIKRKNEELHQLLDLRTQELKASERRFLKMLEVSPAGICTSDLGGHFTFVNDAWYTTTGHPRTESPDTWMQYVLPEDLHTLRQAWEDAKDPSKPIKPVEFRWDKRSDEDFYRWSWAVISREVDDKGAIVELTGALIDITEKKNIELFQQQRAEEAIELRRAQERFIDMTSHEMRNPLSAICLSADASAERLEALSASRPAGSDMQPVSVVDIDDTLADLKIVNHCCVHMTRLIDDVLTLSKLDNQFLIITEVPSRPVDFVSETVSVFKSEMLVKDINCILEIEPSFTDLGVEYVMTDPSRINQLVINILTNAIKFTAASLTRRIKITLDCTTTRPHLVGTAVDATLAHVARTSPMETDEELYLVFSISDTGRGLTPEEISGLFQRFKQANPKTHITYGGSGLGLFICRRIAALFGGEIGVTSTWGKGSTFTFYIPTRRCAPPSGMRSNLPLPSTTNMTTTDGPVRSRRSSPAPADAGSATSSSNATPLSASIDKLSVLIVEDNLVNQKLLEKHLTRAGCVTACANHGQEAIEYIERSRWSRADGPRLDCVLMDIEMPVLDGLSAIKEIRRMQQGGQLRGHVPILAVTANARSEQIENMLASGFDGTVSKPFKIPIILEKMTSLLASLQK